MDHVCSKGMHAVIISIFYWDRLHAVQSYSSVISSVPVLPTPELWHSRRSTSWSFWQSWSRWRRRRRSGRWLGADQTHIPFAKSHTQAEVEEGLHLVWSDADGEVAAPSYQTDSNATFSSSQPLRLFTVCLCSHFSEIGLMSWTSSHAAKHKVHQYFS